MNKKNLPVFFIASSLVISPLFAANIVPKFPFASSKKSSANLKENSGFKIEKSANDYIDFSGTWVGKCDDSDEPVTVVIKNNDDIFTWDGDQFKIGSLETRSNANEENTSFSHTLLEWNSNHSRLLFTSSFFNYHHTQEGKGKDFGYNYGFIILKDNQLRMKFDFHSSEGNFTSICTYDKQ
ncbi:Uncharacterised protein [Legionella beliardensis]|uniref:DUF1579 domain-containing protein n=1 Tax=Legionella beliardensis TaxID=91822 RepID=A0A378HZQ8_9GAMM|nr:hypothetical protein [Legionella beliardensis]STX27950.1 Uncharacterised protein [Legionella beliardensis]